MAGRRGSLSYTAGLNVAAVLDTLPAAMMANVMTRRLAPLRRSPPLPMRPTQSLSWGTGVNRLRDTRTRDNPARVVQISPMGPPLHAPPGEGAARMSSNAFAARIVASSHPHKFRSWAITPAPPCCRERTDLTCHGRFWSVQAVPLLWLAGCLAGPRMFRSSRCSLRPPPGALGRAGRPDHRHDPGSHRSGQVGPRRDHRRQLGIGRIGGRGGSGERRRRHRRDRIRPDVAGFAAA